MDLTCGPDRTGRWRGWCTLRLSAPALQALGLHPDQPPTRYHGPEPPPWWPHPPTPTRRHTKSRRRRK
ncbi:hypothetical protein DZF91_16170 [Actinomadura logoneensis]|uniref:Uncharacterized protein n=1 Tax=Actinomadura logoneensis TaxID=2293572 RepID=A0A372JKR9_9ACTN|nr:hypothetical protein DZF91_16170 [Actinomadura logoneensis]